MNDIHDIYMVNTSVFLFRCMSLRPVICRKTTNFSDWLAKTKFWVESSSENRILTQHVIRYLLNISDQKI